MIRFRLKEDRTLTVIDRTSISFSREDLSAVARLIQAGQVLLHDEPRLPVVAQIKSTMTRLSMPQLSGM